VSNSITKRYTARKFMTQESNLKPANPEISVTSVTEEPTPEKITLWGEIVKGWYWVIFILKMMGSFGGIRQLLISIKRTAIMLIKRLLIQIQTEKR
jgi:hypothetical protein